MNDIAEANRQGGAQALAKSARMTTADDRPFAILRYAKLKTASAIKGTAAHMRRSIRTPNADAELTPGNVILVGTEDPFADAQALIPKPGTRDEDGKLLRRANSVIAVEVMLTTSPEWWRDASREERDRWAGQSLAWLRSEWGEENIAHAELHLDETTGHLTGLIVPIDPRSGGLNARAWIGGRASKNEPGTSRLSGHQTRYAEAVEDLGLRRGRLGSTATHQTLREYQRRASVVLNEEVQPPQIGTPPLIGREAWADEAQARVDAAVAQNAVGAAEARTERGNARTTGTLADRRQEALDTARAERKALTDRLREIPVATVIEDLGGEWDAKEKRWKIGEPGARSHKIEVTDQKWRCAITQAGGRGAIDVVKSVMGTDFNEALSWLADRYGSRETAADLTAHQERQSHQRVTRVAETRPPFTPPVPDPDAWPQVRAHLIDERGLDADLVDTAHTVGDVYAQTKAGEHGAMTNAIFLQRDPDGVPTGAEIKGLRKRRDGTRFSGLAAGSRKDKGTFRAGVDLAKARAVVVVEAAVDAFSALMAARIFRREGVCVVSTAGQPKSGLPRPISDAIPETAQLVAAQDRNLAGDRQFRQLQKADPDRRWKRWRPPEPHEDWNEWAQSYADRQQRSGNSLGLDDVVDPVDPFAPTTGTDGTDTGPQH